MREHLILSLDYRATQGNGAAVTVTGSFHPPRSCEHFAGWEIHECIKALCVCVDTPFNPELWDWGASSGIDL